MVVDSLLNRLGNCKCYVQGFADDVVIYINEKFLSTICDSMQRALNCVKNGCAEIGLNVNANKTYYGIFKNRRKGFFCSKTLLHGTNTEQSGKISGSH
jgi:hypothetical protein